VTLLQTDRLTLREFGYDDADFIVELLNDESFLKFIGDKGVRNADDARRYLADGPMDSYRRHGFGLYLVSRRDNERKLGMCGLVRRDGLDHPDIGFAFLPAHRSQGFAYESAAAVMRYARDSLGLGRILGICNPDNDGSIRLLGKAGFVFERRLRLTADADPVNLYSNEG
jgi:ribosomal-protein-alanine N-acetyltransferase